MLVSCCVYIGGLGLPSGFSLPLHFIISGFNPLKVVFWGKVKADLFLQKQKAQSVVILRQRASVSEFD